MPRMVADDTLRTNVELNRVNVNASMIDTVIDKITETNVNVIPMVIIREIVVDILVRMVAIAGITIAGTIGSPVIDAEVAPVHLEELPNPHHANPTLDEARRHVDQMDARCMRRRTFASAFTIVIWMHRYDVTASRRSIRVPMFAPPKFPCVTHLIHAIATYSTLLMPSKNLNCLYYLA